jgi:glutaredoxin
MSTEPPTRTSLRSLLGLGLVILLAWGAREVLVHRQASQQGQAARVQVRAGDIVMYSTDTCPYCARAREWLTAQELPWRDCNVDHDTQCRADYESKGSPGVPLMKVRGQWQLGFDPSWLVQTLQDQPTS